jgi:hypothetical protein
VGEKKFGSRDCSGAAKKMKVVWISLLQSKNKPPKRTAEPSAGC